MNNLFALIKLNFLSAINPANKRQSKLNKFLIVFALLFLLGFSTFYAYSFIMVFKESNLNNYEFLIAFSILASNFFVIFLFFSSCTNVLYKSKDNDTLFSMPIKKSTIILSKLISILLLGYLYQFVFIVPFTIIYYVYNGFNFLSFLCILFGFFVEPIVPLCLSCLITCFFSFITKKIKYKNLFSTLALFIFFGLFMYFYMQINVYDLMANPNSTNFINYLPWINWLYVSITQNNLLFLLYNIVLAFLLSVFIYFFVYITFFKMCTELNSSIASKSKIYYKNRPLFISLLNKERKKYFSSPMYVFNTLFAYLILLGACIYFAVDKSLINSFNQILPISSFTLSIAFITMCFFILSTANISAVSISIERQSFSLLKGMPLSFSQIIWSKILFAFLVGLPFILVSSIIFAISYNISFWLFLMIVACCMFYNLFICMFGIVMNICFPNLTTQNDTVLVKQSLSSVLSVLIPLAFVMIVTTIYFNINYNLTYYFLIIISILIVLFLTLLYFIIFIAKKKLQKII